MYHVLNRYCCSAGSRKSSSLHRVCKWWIYAGRSSGRILSKKCLWLALPAEDLGAWLRPASGDGSGRGRFGHLWKMGAKYSSSRDWMQGRNSFSSTFPFKLSSCPSNLTEWQFFFFPTLGDNIRLSTRTAQGIPNSHARSVALSTAFQGEMKQGSSKIECPQCNDTASGEHIACGHWWSYSSVMKHRPCEKAA